MARASVNQGYRLTSGTSLDIPHWMVCDPEAGSPFPSDGPPWFPFQQWARRAEPVAPSPLMLLLHPQYGLWHAYRFALVLPLLDAGDAAALSEAAQTSATDVCARCVDQPCLQACPVGAFTGTLYRVDECASHLHAPAGEGCMQSGCLARRACPVGPELRYQPEHAAFHMAAFRQARPG